MSFNQSAMHLVYVVTYASEGGNTYAQRHFQFHGDQMGEIEGGGAGERSIPRRNRARGDGYRATLPWQFSKSISATLRDQSQSLEIHYRSPRGDTARRADSISAVIR